MGLSESDSILGTISVWSIFHAQSNCLQIILAYTWYDLIFLYCSLYPGIVFSIYASCLSCFNSAYTQKPLALVSWSLADPSGGAKPVFQYHFCISKCRFVRFYLRAWQNYSTNCMLKRSTHSLRASDNATLADDRWPHTGQTAILKCLRTFKQMSLVLSVVKMII